MEDGDRKAEDRHVTVNVSQSESTLDGVLKGCGFGCSIFIVAALLLMPFGLIGAGFDVPRSPGLIVIGVVLAVIELVVLGGIAIVLLDRYFRWGLTDPPEETSGGEEPREKRGLWHSHPDD